MLSFWMVGLTLAMSHCNGLDMDEEVRPDTLLPFRITTEEFKKEVIATTKGNRKVKFDCKFLLVHNGKTVFLENQAPSLEMAAKDRKGKGGKKQKAKKAVNKPMTISAQIDASKVPVIKEPIQIKPRLSKVSCAIHSIGPKIRAHADNFEIISSSTSNPRTVFTLDISTNPDVIRDASIRTVKLLSEKEILNQLEIKSKIDKLGNLTPEEKADLNKLMQGSVFNFVKHENEALLKKSKKPFIQFNKKTDQLGLNARLLNALRVQANNFKGKQKDSKKVEDINQLIDDMSENCQNSTDGFEGTDPSNVTCDPCDKYRRIDGICNNLENKELGTAGIAMRRLLPNAYQDGFSSPRGGFVSNLPNPRKISVALHHHPAFPSTSQATPITTKGFTHMAMQFGQFLDHDITLSAQQELDCCAEFVEDNNVDPVQRRCFNIGVKGDPFFESKFVDCHSFTRSDFICTGNDVREQINGITAFIDASNVYGSDTTRATALRLNDGTGRLKENVQQTSSGHLPTRAQCGLSDPGLPEDLVAGDVRANVQPTLASTHTLFLNEHNRIATALKQEADSRVDSFLSGLSPNQADAILYEEARKIVGATLQNIVYEEYVPIILGSAGVAAQGLALSGSSAYDETTDPSVLNEFATVAYRFGHSLINGLFNRHEAPWFLRHHYFDNDQFILDNEWKREMDGVIQQECPARDLPCTHDITNFLFKLPQENFGDDLIARNIQRGRDHGIPSYRKLREFCGLADLNETPPLPPSEINATVWNEILAVYSNVDDIDAFTGGLAEEAPADGLVGPTFACIIGRQFKRLMSGDRFFFTHATGSEHVRGLLPKSKETVRKRTLGDVICDNANEGQHALTTPPALHVMKQVSQSNPQVRCKERDSLDISGIVDDIEEFNPCVTMSSSTSTSSTTETTSSSTTTETTSTSTTSKTTSSSTTSKTTSSSTTSKTTSFKPLPGYCASASSELVDYDQEWSDGCLDLKGNLYAKDQFLTSCCGCFKIICNSTEPSAYSRHIADRVFFWNKTLEVQCCQDCQGKVFSAGTVMDTEILDDKCSTTVTTICVFVGQENRAIAEMSYTYRNCCSDETGLHPIGTTIQVPKTCSKRTCDREDGQIHSAWITKQVVSGCNCCPLPPICSEPKVTCSVEEGNLVEDGGVLVVNPGKKHLKCCEGKFLEENFSFGK